MRSCMVFGSILVLVLCCLFEVVDSPVFEDGPSVGYDFYRKSCPEAGKIVHDVVGDVYRARASIAPALVRLLFHDCFIEGCDASVLLDPVEGMASEKDSPRNDGLKGFDVIDAIKSQLELACPGIVSCADIVALAGREGILLAGGPSYPLFTGRRDSLLAYQDKATQELPSPDADLAQTLAAFASRGFDEKEAVTLLGATDASKSSECFYDSLMCNENEPAVVNTGYNVTGPGDFGSLYYRRLLQRDQQLMAGEHTATWVRAYAADPSLFRKDFAMAMMKLSHLGVLTGSEGQVRGKCSRVV